MIATTGIHHIALLLEDLERAERFYVDVLGLTLDRRWPDESGGTRSIWLTAGASLLMLERAATGRARGEAGGGGWHLLALAIRRENRPAVEAHLAAAGVKVESRSDYSLYFRDPEGNRIALSHWPEKA